MAIHIVHDPKAKRFYATIDGKVARLEYEARDAEILDYYSTFVPPELRGRGIATELAEEALRFALQNRQRVIPSCWFVRDVMDRNRGFDALRVGTTSPNA